MDPQHRRESNGCCCPEAEINDRRKHRPIRIPWMLESGISAGMMVSSARAASASSQEWKRAASVNRVGTPSSSIRKGYFFKQGGSASPRQNCTRGRCCRQRSPDRGPGQAWPVRRPARRPGSPPGSSAIRERSTRCADSPSPTSCCRPPTLTLPRKRGREGWGQANADGVLLEAQDDVAVEEVAREHAIARGRCSLSWRAGGAPRPARTPRWPP
jgi:hypothetical protein